MLSRIRSFISRHRRKFFGMAVTGALIWGGWSYFNWRMRQSEEDYVREVLNRAKRHMHYKSSAQAAEKQAVALIPVATKATNNALDANAIVCELKGGDVDSRSQKSNDTSLPQSKDGKGAPLTPAERVAKWNELKRVSVARAVAYAYVPSILIVFVRLQLSLLGGYVFRSCGGDNIAAFLNGSDDRQHSKEEKQTSMPVEIQEAYLSLSQYFMEGKPNIGFCRQGNSSKDTQENLASESCWSMHSNNQNNVEGKSKLNFNVPSADSNNSVFTSPQEKHVIRSSSVKSTVEFGEYDSKIDTIKNGSGSGDASSSSEAGAAVALTHTSLSSGNLALGMGDGAFKVGSQQDELLRGQFESSSVRGKKQMEKEDCASISVQGENQTVRPSRKGEFLPNDTVGRYNSSDGVPKGCESLHNGVADVEMGNQKDVCVKETEEDSGRCSGADEASEEEVMEDKKRKSGIEILCSLLENKVGRVVDGVSLKMPISLADAETLFWGVLTSIRSNPAEDPAFNLPKYLLPPQDVLKGMEEHLEARLDCQASSLFHEMVIETADLLETKEVIELVQSCVSAGLGHIMDRLANYFPSDTFSLSGPQHSAATAKQHVQGNFIQQTIPMAKLIPMISKVAFEDGYPWFSQLLEMSNLKDFGANVYEAFTH